MAWHGMVKADPPPALIEVFSSARSRKHKDNRISDQERDRSHGLDKRVFVDVWYGTVWCGDAMLDHPIWIVSG